MKTRVKIDMQNGVSQINEAGAENDGIEVFIKGTNILDALDKFFGSIAFSELVNDAGVYYLDLIRSHMLKCISIKLKDLPNGMTVMSTTADAESVFENFINDISLLNLLEHTVCKNDDTGEFEVIVEDESEGTPIEEFIQGYIDNPIDFLDRNLRILKIEPGVAWWVEDESNMHLINTLPDIHTTEEENSYNYLKQFNKNGKEVRGFILHGVVS